MGEMSKMEGGRVQLGMMGGKRIQKIEGNKKTGDMEKLEETINYLKYL